MPDPAAPESVIFFDFDGDGRDEAGFVRRNLVDSNCRVEPTVEWWTTKAGNLTRYAPTANLHAFWVTDYDCDSRPDLLINPYPNVDLGFFGMRARAGVEFSLLAHSLSDGSFSLNDEIALKYASALCPARNTPPFAGDRTEWPHDAHCARLRGMDGASLERALQSRCAQMKPDTEEYMVTREFCEQPQMAPFFRTALPLQLGELPQN
jgi:hypothetical protein